jgi:Wiskott-Aldrich syndrome protein
MRSSPSVNDHRQSYNGPFIPFLPVSGDQSRSQPTKPNAQELREEVEAAKRMYKAMKQRYRQDREQRRREKLGHRPAVLRHSAMDGGVPVAQAEAQRGRYPEVERVGVPRRSHTHLGHGPSRHLDKNLEDLTTRAMSRIAKKLSDMGFSESACPALPGKIKAQMPTNGVISKEAEDDVVTTLLEELLGTPSPNVASGSGQRDIDMEEA